MERFATFPFSVGCISHSSVEVVDGRPKTASHPQSSSALTRNVQPNGKSKNTFALPKPNVFARIHKVIKGFKSLTSYMFHYDDDDDDDDDDDEREMVIGFPTDVRHVGHIGWEGFNGGTSLKKLELAMAAQPHGPVA